MSKSVRFHCVIEQVHKYIRDQRLLQPGDRVAVAVSGGADSVALLRVLVELRQELGIVLSVAHFHHGIRGAEADSDYQFVSALAETFSLELHSSSADVPAHARERKLSMETAARELRHLWFAKLVGEKAVDKIATAHTIDDQAETVLMRILRGTGSQGLAGIFPTQTEKHLVRPLLATTRGQVEAYLVALGQTWREDSSNRDLSHTRNRVRHELLPLLERNFNSGIRQTLADLAEIARAEAEYWDAEVPGLVTRLIRFGKLSRSGRSASGEASRTLALDLRQFGELPLAFRRQVLHAVARRLGIGLEFKHIQQLTDRPQDRPLSKRLALPGGYVAVWTYRELQFSPAHGRLPATDYQYLLPVPGEVSVQELGTMIRARVITPGVRDQRSHGSESLLNRGLLADQLQVRNWRAGDKFFPANTRAPKKLKELLQAGRLGRELSADDRRLWPVVESAGRIVWVRGLPVPAALAANGDDAVVIEEEKIVQTAE